MGKLGKASFELGHRRSQSLRHRKPEQRHVAIVAELLQAQDQLGRLIAIEPAVEHQQPPEAVWVDPEIGHDPRQAIGHFAGNDRVGRKPLFKRGRNAVGRRIGDERHLGRAHGFARHVDENGRQRGLEQFGIERRRGPART